MEEIIKMERKENKKKAIESNNNNNEEKSKYMQIKVKQFLFTWGVVVGWFSFLCNCNCSCCWLIGFYCFYEDPFEIMLLLSTDCIFLSFVTRQSI